MSNTHFEQHVKYEIRHQYINKFKSYLNSWKQYVRYSEGSRLSKQIKCHVSQGSTLGSLLFLYLVMISHVTKFLDPIMFVDDTNLFYLNELFENVNNKLANATDWCFANKLSIQAKKIFFFINKRLEIIYRLKPPDLKSNNIILQRVTELRFLGVMVDENLKWQTILNWLKVKSQKILESYLKLVYTTHISIYITICTMMYFLFIYSYINYGTIARTSTSQTKIKKMFTKQKLSKE